MRERICSLARNIRQARHLAHRLPPNSAGTDFLRRYRRVTALQGALYPNPDRAACQEHPDRARESSGGLRAASEGSEQAAAMLEPASATADLYTALAQTARY